MRWQQRIAAGTAFGACPLCRIAGNSAARSAALSACNLDITCLEELRQLPCISGQDLKEYRDFLCVSQGEVQRIVTLQTSGSAGPPKRLAFSEQDLARTRDFFSIGMSQLVQPGDRLLVLLPGAQCPDGVADLLRQALTKADVAVFSGAADLSTLYDELLRRQPHCLVAAPYQLAYLLTKARTAPDFLAALHSVRGILSSGDILDTTLRTALETTLSCCVLDHYGMTESCFGGGVECPAHDGYHLRELDLLFEILKPNTNIPVADGETGELVLTTLHREAMPLIRYRTGDAACWLPGPCACGSPLRRLAPLQGRYCLEQGSPVLRHIPKGGFHARTASPAL
ncbi:MAG: AMP-binding protein [Desulfovibrionaceae bacterium]|nr:AMP-binding protein [Desulfovibrionaceae bacterium]